MDKREQSAAEQFEQIADKTDAAFINLLYALGAAEGLTPDQIAASIAEDDAALATWKKEQGL